MDLQVKLDVIKFSLIPVLVTGIQCAQVFGRGRSLGRTVIYGADAPWLDSCYDPRNKPEDRNESVEQLEAT
jgi:hypothetical protein